MLATASVVAGDASARTTTSTGNTIATKHSHLMICVLAGGNMNAHKNLLTSATFHVASTVCIYSLVEWMAFSTVLSL